MRTFLLTWNAVDYPWRQFMDAMDGWEVTENSNFRWSTGSRRDIDVGDRFFLIRLGRDPRGIVGAGTVTSPAFDGPHWRLDLADEGRTSIYVDIHLGFIREEPVIAMAELERPPLDGMYWHPQGSGVLIPDDIAEELQELWDFRVESR